LAHGESAVTTSVRSRVVICLIAAAALVAVWSNRITERIRIPTPALFLLAAAIASDVFPHLGAPVLEGGHPRCHCGVGGFVAWPQR